MTDGQKQILLDAGVKLVDTERFHIYRVEDGKTVMRSYATVLFQIKDEREAAILLLGKVKDNNIVYVSLRNGVDLIGEMGYKSYVKFISIPMNEYEIAEKNKKSLQEYYNTTPEVITSTKSNKYKYLLIR